MKSTLAAIGLVLSLFCSFCFGEEPDAKKSLVLTFSAEKEQITVGEEFWVRLTFENQGKEPVHIVRPRAGTITVFDEFGTMIYIDGPGGKYRPLPLPRAVYPITDEQIFELAPGEFVGARVPVNSYSLLTKKARPHPEVGNTPGKYTAVLNYDLQNRGFFQLEKEKREELFLGPVSSPPIEFEVLQGNE